MSMNVVPPVRSNPSASITEQMLVEHQILRHIMESLRTVVGWSPSAEGGTRKVSSLRFIVSSLQRHLEYLLRLEEEDGYMWQLAKTRPHLTHRVSKLRDQHDNFREVLGQAVSDIDRISTCDDGPGLLLCRNLIGLLDELEAHSDEEIRLVQDAFLRDEGGEG